MLVRDLLRQKQTAVVTVQPKDELSAAIRLLMVHNIGALPVVDAHGAVVGLVAERDIVRAVYHRLDALPALRVQDVMRPAATCDANDTLERAMERMTFERQRHIVVCDEGKLVGLVSVGDAVKYRVEEFKTEAGVLRDYVTANRATR